MALCRATMQEYKCDEFRKHPEFSQYLRSCSYEAICQEQTLANQYTNAIPGCTGVSGKQVADAWSNVKACATSTECLKQVPMETLRNLGRMAIGVAETAANLLRTGYNLVFNTKETITETKRNAGLIHRSLQCLNTMYSYRVACELAGGTFAPVSAALAIRGTIARQIANPRLARLGTRASINEAREAAGRGVRSAEMRNIRATAQGAAATTVVATSQSQQSSRARPAASEVRTNAKPAKPPAVLSASQSKLQADYLRSKLGRQNTTVEQRKAFEALAYKTFSDGITIFVDFQNSLMKYLNDNLGNKNVVTAITNHRLELTFEKLKALRTRYPQLREFSYDDFKSGRLAFEFTDGKIPKEFRSDVDQILAQTEAEHVAELARIGIIPEGVDLVPPNRWFAAGTGQTADQANVATRYAARTGQTNVDFWDPVVRTNLEGRLSRTDTYRAGLMTSLRNTPLAEKLPNGQYIPSTEVYESYRGAKSTEDFARRIQERTQYSISAQAAQNLKNYLSMLDEWSTGLLVVENRQAVTFSGSKHNGVNIDISGMGALNARELARSLVGEKDITQALVKAREAERRATEIFERNKAAIVTAARSSLKGRGIEADIRVSGDDIVVLPTTGPLDANALAALHEAVAKSPSTSNVRISAVAPKVTKADELGVRGESLEKKVRGLTLGSITDQSRYTLMVVTDAQGAPTLQVRARNGEVSADVERAFQDAFEKARKN